MPFLPNFAKFYALKNNVLTVFAHILGIPNTINKQA